MFFGNNALPFNAVLSALGPYQNGLEVLAAGGASPTAIAYLRDVYRYLLLAARFDLDAPLLSQIFANPQPLSLTGAGSTPYLPNAEDLRTLARFAQLRKQYPGVRESLIEYLTSRTDASAIDASALAALFGWDAQAVTTLVGASRNKSAGLNLVLSIAEAVGYLQATGMDAPLLLSL